MSNFQKTVRIMDKERSCDILTLQATPYTRATSSRVSDFTSLPVIATGRLVFRSITYEIHGFDFSDALLSCLERCRRVVLLPSHTHQISRKVVRLWAQYQQLPPYRAGYSCSVWHRIPDDRWNCGSQTERNQQQPWQHQNVTKYPDPDVTWQVPVPCQILLLLEQLQTILPDICNDGVFNADTFKY